MKKSDYGYCAVTADFLHIGHLNFIKQAKEQCKSLIVGIMSDECVKEYKGKYPLMSQNQRMELVRNLRCVDSVHLQNTFQFDHHVLRLKEFYGKKLTIFDSEEHNRQGADIYLKRTEGISSTQYKNENINNSQLSI